MIEIQISFAVKYVNTSDEKNTQHLAVLTFPYCEYGERAKKMKEVDPFVLLQTNEDFQEKLLQNFGLKNFQNIDCKNWEKGIFSSKKENSSDYEFHLVVQKIQKQEFMYRQLPNGYIKRQQKLMFGTLKEILSK